MAAERKPYFVTYGSRWDKNGTIHAADWYRVKSTWNWLIRCRSESRLPYGELRSQQEIADSPAQFCKRCFPNQEEV